MNEYQKFKDVVGEGSEKLPHILGLTASIVTQKCDKEKFLLRKCELENATDSKAITTEDLASLLK
jgi:hypothetical protein